MAISEAEKLAREIYPEYASGYDWVEWHNEGFHQDLLAEAERRLAEKAKNEEPAEEPKDEAPAPTPKRRPARQKETSKDSE